jgi:hypothetical protein
LKARELSDISGSWLGRDDLPRNKNTREAKRSFPA